MSERKWHKGPPPHIGWWNASMSRDNHLWRWWDGRQWSWGAYATEKDWQAAINACRPASPGDRSHGILWTDYYPRRARVPRINPAATSGEKP